MLSIHKVNSKIAYAQEAEDMRCISIFRPVSDKNRGNSFHTFHNWADSGNADITYQPDLLLQNNTCWGIWSYNLFANSCSMSWVLLHNVEQIYRICRIEFYVDLEKYHVLTKNCPVQELIRNIILTMCVVSKSIYVQHLMKTNMFFCLKKSNGIYFFQCIG